MIADQPLVLYESDRKVGRKEMDDLSDRWYKKRNGKTLAGKEVSLGDYLRSDIEHLKEQ